jgi:hypothetical protein
MLNMRSLNSALKNLFNYAKIAHFHDYSNGSHRHSLALLQLACTYRLLLRLIISQAG